MRPSSYNSGREPPIVLVKWYDVTKWMLERVEAFPKNQRFVFGQRLADRTLGILELLVEAAYRHKKNDHLAIQTLQKCLPKHHVIGIDCVELIWGLGAIHCLTQQQPAW